MTRAVGIAFVVALSASALVAQDASPVYRAAVSGVRIEVAVTRRGRPVTGLGLAEFAILDSGVVQQPVSLSVGTLPVDVTIALDVSGSVQGAVLRYLGRAIEQVRGRLRPGDRLRLLTFTDRVGRVFDFTDRQVDTTRVFSQIVPAGGTAIFDAVAVALSSRAEPDRRQLVILFSDGVDSTSTIDPETLISVARHSTPMLAFVLPGPVPAAVGVRAGPGLSSEQLFAALAAETGGVVIASAAVADIGDTFNQVLDTFRSVYVLHYTPTGVPAKGFHPLTVRVTRSGQYEVRARRGYVSE